MLTRHEQNKHNAMSRDEGGVTNSIQQRTFISMFHTGIRHLIRLLPVLYQDSYQGVEPLMDISSISQGCQIELRYVQIQSYFQPALMFPSIDLERFQHILVFLLFNPPILYLPSTMHHIRDPTSRAELAKELNLKSARVTTNSNTHTSKTRRGMKSA